ncbi:hypothetical protein KC365_g6034 [Hortaea werneckii]|nr:hypothetical protein KC365_g6034 [Hortaea werneckii]KAI7399610.1 hypothetical protein KC328_g3965 [Hortaea werneckii]
MRFPPLEVLSTWPTPNYDDPKTRGQASLIVNIIFLFMVLVAVALRVYSRTSVRRWFGLDDIMIGLATLFTIGLTVVVVLANERFGWDRHIYDIPFDHIEKANIIALTAKVAFTLAATFTRLSLCMFYYRLVGDSGIVWFRWVVHANVAFTISVCITFVFLSVFLCTPVQYYWEFPPTTDGHCLDEGIATLAAGALNLAADFLATITPIPLVMRLNMRLKYRIGVSVLFGLGFIVIVAGIVRTYYIWKGLMDTYDETWSDLCVRAGFEDIVSLFDKQHSRILFTRTIRPKQPASHQRKQHDFIETVIKEKLLQRNCQVAVVSKLAIAEGFGQNTGT